MFFISGGVILAFLIAGAWVSNAYPEEDVEGAAWNWLFGIGEYFGWLYVLATTFFLVFVIWLMLSRYSSVKIGPDDSKPEFSTTAWFAMLFTAGMGIGLVFWGTAEPTGYVEEGVIADPEDPLQAADSAMEFSLFHWGLHPWAVYIVLGLALGYFAFRKGLPLRPASAFYPLIGDQIYRWPGHIIDILAVFGTMFGLATSLGIGTQQINSGLSTVFPAIPDESIPVQIVIIGVITGIAVVSVVLGIDKGVRRLSVINIWLAGALLLFVFVTGPTLFILSGMSDWTGTYLSSIVSNSFNVASPGLEPEFAEWQTWWTLFYWGWWISWAPFVGMFIARISYGRTIRQFIVGTLFAPVGVSIAWFSVFGGSGLYYDLLENGEIGAGGESGALFALLTALVGDGVLFTLVALLAVIVVAVFFITSSDSGSLVIDMLTSGGDPNPVVSQRAGWAITEGLVTIVLVVAGGSAALMALRAASVTTGLPFAIVLIAVVFGLIAALRRENIAAIQARALGLPASIVSATARDGDSGGSDGSAAVESSTGDAPAKEKTSTAPESEAKDKERS